MGAANLHVLTKPVETLYVCIPGIQEQISWSLPTLQNNNGTSSLANEEQLATVVPLLHADSSLEC